jgi:hypothetical protein
MAGKPSPAQRIAESVIAAVAVAAITGLWKRSVVGSLCMFFAGGCAYYLIRSSLKTGNPRGFWIAAIPYLAAGIVLGVVLILVDALII